VPTDTTIELRFDRFLLPVPNLVGGASLYSGRRGIYLSATYDLLERVVVLHPGSALSPNTLYTVQILPSVSQNQGFWAFDGAPLADGPVPLRFSFTTANRAAANATPAPAPALDDCFTLTSAPAGSGESAAPPGPLYRCASCHVTPPAQAPDDLASWRAAYPPMGLTVSGSGLAQTAIGHTSHETETGSSLSGPGLQTSPRFGVQMNLVDPGFPEKSYLMYKLLLRADNYALEDGEVCPPRFHSPVSDADCAVPDPLELARLGDRFVLGDGMPKDASDGQRAPLSREGLRRVADWIAAGAPCEGP
jgi:hypothetical protein